MNSQEQVPVNTIESVVTPFSKGIIEWCLETLAPEVVVVGRRITEDGWELVLEGNTRQVSELVYVLAEGVK